ncbi:helix-turn-helix transcriptional regulator [Asanoa sp. NPDC050611]|uniref:helix-turn-helix transcriptional regulator n=1 Tax=Asanoa sp. NPDC050611 TaxID=3157098 RepID=UPI0033CE71A0
MTSTDLRVRVRNGPAVAHYPPGATLGPRVLPCFEFVWMLTGRASWRRTGDDPVTHELRPGQLLLTRPGVREHYTWDPDRPCTHAYVTFYVDDPGPLGPPEAWPLVRDLATDPLPALCRYLLRTGEPRTAQVLAWLLDLFVAGPLPDPADDLPEHVDRLVDHLRAAWSDGVCRPLELAELAAAAHVSPGHLARLFRERYGRGPVGAVELVRLARAAVLLERSNLSVAAVAAACGFVNAFHFSRRFRQAYGCAPRDYRADRPADPLDPVRRAGLFPVARRLLADRP